MKDGGGGKEREGEVKCENVQQTSRESQRCGGASGRLNSTYTTAGFGAMGEVPHERRAWDAREGGVKTRAGGSRA